MTGSVCMCVFTSVQHWALNSIVLASHGYALNTRPEATFSTLEHSCVKSVEMWPNGAGLFNSYPTSSGACWSTVLPDS